MMLCFPGGDDVSSCEMQKKDELVAEQPAAEDEVKKRGSDGEG